jgi:[2Fe-2S] binding domain
VLVDGEPVRACLMFAVQADGTSITTVEGMAGEDGRLHPLQEAFVEHHGLQCGFCTPGMLMSALHLLDTEPDPDRVRIREEMAGGICRCTGYQGIVDAVEAAAVAPCVATIRRRTWRPRHDRRSSLDHLALGATSPLVTACAHSTTAWVATACAPKVGLVVPSVARASVTFPCMRASLFSTSSRFHAGCRAIVLFRRTTNLIVTPFRARTRESAHTGGLRPPGMRA